MSLLQSEIRLIHENIESINFERQLIAEWLANLTYCHTLLVLSAPKDCIPILSIG